MSHSQTRLSPQGKIYLLFIAIGTVLPVYMLIEHFSEQGVSLSLFIRSIFVNWASSALVSDLLISSFVYWVLLSHELNILKRPQRILIVFILLNLFVGLSCSLPIFLFWRELQKNH